MSEKRKKPEKSKLSKRKKTTRFVQYTEEQFEDKREEQKNANTLKADRKTEKVFLEYLEANHSERVQNNFEYWTYSPQLLDSILCKYWFEARTQEGDYYNINSLKGLLYGLNRNLQRHGVQLDLTTSECFTKSQRCFEDAKRELKAIGKAVVKHYDEIKPKGRIISLAKLVKSAPNNLCLKLPIMTLR